MAMHISGEENYDPGAYVQLGRSAGCRRALFFFRATRARVTKRRG